MSIFIWGKLFVAVQKLLESIFWPPILPNFPSVKVSETRRFSIASRLLPST